MGSVQNVLLSFGTSSLGFIYHVINETVKQEKYSISAATLPKATLQSLPIEVLLHIFSFMELKSYIISRAVCQDWRRLLPLADIHPIRRRLFQLFQTIVNTPRFYETRPWTLENLQPFDRHAYIDALLQQYPAIPEEFRIWILEWPARLAIGSTWPGLPFVYCRTRSAERRNGANWLGYMDDGETPQLSAVIYKQKTPEVKVIPGLLIWKFAMNTDWLVFSRDEPSLFGRVYSTDSMVRDMSAVIPHIYEPDDSPDEDWDPDSEGYHTIHPDWVSYLEDMWATTVKWIGNDDPFPYPDLPIPTPPNIYFNRSGETIHPTFAWNVRDSVTEYLKTS